MKTQLVNRLVCIIGITIGAIVSANAQKVYPVKYSSNADVKVFVVKYESQADLLVYSVKYESQAKGNEGKWFKVKYQSQADKKIYFTDMSRRLI
jgi:hypothetical protein